MGAAVPIVAAVAGGVASSMVSSSMQDEPPAPIRKLPTDLQTRKSFKPVNYMSIMNTLMGDKMDIVKGVDGEMKIVISNPNGRSVVPMKERNIPEKALAVIMLSESMTDLGKAIEEMERTSPYLIPQNQELINSYKTAVNNALDRGFDFRQQAIDTKLSKMGLSNSSTALGVQIALARERANAMAEAELKQAELAQGLKQQAIGNLVTRGKLMQDQANTEMKRFEAENTTALQLREQDIKREIAQASLEQDRQKFLTAAGVDMFNNADYNALQAANIDNNALNDLNNANIQAYDRTRNPLAEVMNTAGGALVSGGINYGMNQLFAKNEPVPDFAWKNPPSLNLFKK